MIETLENAKSEITTKTDTQVLEERIAKTFKFYYEQSEHWYH